MSNIPQYSPQNAPAPRPRLSGAALTSFILGIVFCIPFLTSLTALIFAAVGMRATRNGNKSGRGFAITGLILGILGLLFWAGIGAFAAFLLAGSQAPRALAHDFARDIAAGNRAAVRTEADPTLSDADLDKLHDDLAPFGAYVRLTCTSINLNATGAGEECQLSGTIRYSTGTHLFNAVVRKDGTGTWKIAGFHVF